MAEDIVARLDEQDELRELLRELSQELALCDMIRFKNDKLLANVHRFNDEKAKSLAEEYRLGVEDINEAAAMNMNEEIRLMDEFSNEVSQFNDSSADYLLHIASQKIRAKGGK